jgi:hypothetical protein
MTGEPLHETGITVSAAMPAPDIGVDTVIKPGNSRFGQNGLGKDLFDFHLQNYNGEPKKWKVSQALGF